MNQESKVIVEFRLQQQASSCTSV